MRRLLIYVGFMTVVYTSTAQTFTSKDSIQISSMIDDWNKAWELKDYQLAAKWYSKDAIFTNAFGDSRDGQKEIRLLLKRVFSLPFVMTAKTETSSYKLQILNGNHAIVHTTVVTKGQQMPDGSILLDRYTTHLRVFSLTDDQWKISAHLISDARSKQSPKH